MRLKLLMLTSAILLAACQGNSQGDEINLDPADDTESVEPGSETGTIPEDTVPDEDDSDDEPSDGSTTPAPKICVASHSGTQGVETANSKSEFVFYPDFSTNKLQSYDVLSSTSTPTEATGSNSTAIPYQSISGSTLATQKGFHNGEWLFETNSKNLIFTDTLTGEVRQVSSWDFAGYQVCSLTQVKPAIDRMSEFYISYGASCSLTSKVNLAMSATDSATVIPNPAIIEGTAIYDGDANWLGQLYKIVDNGVAKLVLQKADFCSQNELFEFTAVDNSWSAEQYIDGSLLIRLENKVYYLSLVDMRAWIEDDSTYSLPDTALITLVDARADVWLDKNNTEIFYTNLNVDSEMPSNNKAELFVYDIASMTTSAAISLYAGVETEKTIVGFEKILLDDHSVWIESRYTTGVAELKVYHRRYSRWDIAGKALDTTVKFDYPLIIQPNSTPVWYPSNWHSIANKVYLKVNARTLLTQAIDPLGEKDYLLEVGIAPSIEPKVWHFIKQDSAINKEFDAAIAWDYTDHASNQYVPELIKSDGTSSLFPVITRNILYLEMTAQFKGLSLFRDISCTSGCDDGDPTSQYEYQVISLKHSINELTDLYHETCDIINTPLKSQTCTVNP